MEKQTCGGLKKIQTIRIESSKVLRFYNYYNIRKIQLKSHFKIYIQSIYFISLTPIFFCELPTLPLTMSSKYGVPSGDH